MNKKDFLRKTLNVYWFRPETALLRAMDLMQLKHYKFKNPILDLGCGDGVFSFLVAGGEFGINFDVFRSVKDSKAFENFEDIYNHYDENCMVSDIINLPEYKVDVGLDINEGSLKKAADLKFYNKLVKHDANLPLPFDDEKFNTIFSNAIYHVKLLCKLLIELRRVLSPGGQIILMLPDAIAKDYMLDIKYIRIADKWRYSHMAKHGHNYKEWEYIFEQCGLNVMSHRMQWTKNSIKFWDIGLRPISPYLIKMANSLAEERRAEIKEEWIGALISLLVPLCDEYLDEKCPLAFHLFQLVKY